MNIHPALRAPVLFGMAAAAVLFAAAPAGAQTTAYGQYNSYSYAPLRIQTPGPSQRTAKGWVTTVRLLDASGRPVPDAQVYYRTWRQTNPGKTVPNQTHADVPLRADGQDDYQLVTSRPVEGAVPLDVRLPGQGMPTYAMAPGPAMPTGY